MAHSFNYAARQSKSPLTAFGSILGDQKSEFSKHGGGIKPEIIIHSCDFSDAL